MIIMEGEYLFLRLYPFLIHSTDSSVFVLFPLYPGFSLIGLWTRVRGFKTHL